MVKRYAVIIPLLSLLFLLVVYVARQAAEREMGGKIPISSENVGLVSDTGDTFAQRDGRVYVAQPVTGEIREVDVRTARTLIDHHGWVASSLENARAYRARQIVDEAVRREITPARSWWFGALDGASLGAVRLAMPNVIFDASSEMFPAYAWLGRLIGFGLVAFAVNRIFQSSRK